MMKRSTCLVYSAWVLILGFLILVGAWTYVAYQVGGDW